MSLASRKAHQKAKDEQMVALLEEIHPLDRVDAIPVVVARLGCSEECADIIITAMNAEKRKNAVTGGEWGDPDSCNQRVLAIIPLPKNLGGLDAMRRDDTLGAEMLLEVQSLLHDYRDRRELLSQTISKANTARRKKTP